MKRKILSVFLTLCMLLSLGLTAFAEEIEFVKNGDFETVNGSAFPSWGVSGGAWGKEFSVSDDAHGGKNALRITTEGNVYAYTRVSGLTPGVEYTINGYVKLLEAPTADDGGAAVKLEYFKGGEYVTGGAVRFYNGKVGEWAPVAYTFECPENADGADILLRVLKGGDVLWDDFSMVGEKAAEKEVVIEAETEEAEFFTNGSFEETSGDSAKSWATSGGKWGKEFTVSDDAKEGENALRITTEGNAYASAKITGLIPGVEYTINGYVKLLTAPSSDDSGAAIKLEYFKEGTYVTGGAIKFYNSKVGEWATFAHTFECPENVDSAEVLVRVLKGGDVLWDGFSMVGKKLVSGSAGQDAVEESNVEVLPALAGHANLISGATFEALDENGKVPGAQTYKSDMSEWLSIVDNATRGGKVLYIHDDVSVNNPWMCFEVPVSPGARYQLHGWILGSSANLGSPGMKMEYYNADGKIQGDETRLMGAYDKDAWQEFAQVVDVPLKDIAKAKVYIRLYGAGEIYWDNLDFYMVREASRFTSDSGFFYYRDETKGKAAVTLNTITYPDFAGNTVVFKLLDGETVLAEKTEPAQAGEIVWNYSPLLMTEVEKSYTLRFEYINAAGQVLESQNKEVLVYNRPTNLTKDGQVLDANGNIIFPVMGYHAYPSSFARAKEMGMNVQQCVHQSKDLANVQAVLEQAKKDGVMLLIPLYANMLPAGHPDNQELNKTCIEAVKDHPNLLGYMVMDEPFGHTADVGGPEAMYKVLQDSYKFIRQHDKEHLIFITETNMQYVELTGHCCDILSVDPYIGAKTQQIGRKVSDDVSGAIREVETRKPVWSIVQAWPWDGDTGGEVYEPTANDIRSFLYQALISGAKGLGYYEVQNLSDSSVSKIWERELAKGITYFNENEWEDAKKAFITGEYPTFAQNTDESSPVWYKVFVKGNDLYAVVINREDKVNTVSIPLTSIDGSVTIGSFTAVADEISGIASFSGNGTLTATLSEAQVVRYRLTVRDDLSGLTTSKFNDIYNYGWAKRAIDTLYQKGIANAKGVTCFAPGEQITRGDFAMFLIKTLGLTAEGTDNFADVNPNAEYADAIRIGRALGILKGTDGVNYLPETPISRQDLMVICARGMRLVKELEAGDASQFADAASIADYAVADIAAMVRASIVNGYEDGTVRPLGNTTRAEAAVIMDRIMTWDTGL
ncbi:MAG: hypothetical protein E7408_05825 [Ruminococcaceae bacterium]|nr:hypothetical protein [Oscillospiraceae bacterium]